MPAWGWPAWAAVVWRYTRRDHLSRVGVGPGSSAVEVSPPADEQTAADHCLSPLVTVPHPRYAGPPVASRGAGACSAATSGLPRPRLVETLQRQRHAETSSRRGCGPAYSQSRGVDPRCSQSRGVDPRHRLAMLQRLALADLSQTDTTTTAHAPGACPRPPTGRGGCSGTGSPTRRTSTGPPQVLASRSRAARRRSRLTRAADRSMPTRSGCHDPPTDAAYTAAVGPPVEGREHTRQQVSRLEPVSGHPPPGML